MTAVHTSGTNQRSLLVMAKIWPAMKRQHFPGEIEKGQIIKDTPPLPALYLFPASQQVPLRTALRLGQFFLTLTKLNTSGRYEAGWSGEERDGWRRRPRRPPTPSLQRQPTRLIRRTRDNKIQKNKIKWENVCLFPNPLGVRSEVTVCKFSQQGSGVACTASTEAGLTSRRRGPCVLQPKLG